jgi:hypothetical protein
MADLLFGITIPCTPALSAVRIIAPILWVSSIPSRMTTKGDSSLLFASLRISSNVEYSKPVTSATTP